MCKSKINLKLLPAYYARQFAVYCKEIDNNEKKKQSQLVHAATSSYNMTCIMAVTLLFTSAG